MKTNLSILPAVLRSTPRYVPPLAKAFFKKFLAEQFNYRFATRRSNKLVLITFRITPVCNLACKMCGQGGKTGVMKGERARQEAKNILPVERYMRLVDEVSRINPILYVWGGEPFLYPGFLDLAQYMAKKCKAFTVNTNGTYLAENAERIVRDQWAGVYVSLDGTEEINDAVRGKGSYRRVVEGFKALNREKEKQGSKLPNLGVVSVVTNISYPYMDRIVEEARQFKLSWHVINLGTYTDRATIDKQHKVMKELFGIEGGDVLEGFLNGMNEGIDGGVFEKVLTKIQGFNFGYPILTVPVEKAEGIDKFYNDFTASPRNHCICPWLAVDIDYNGNVHFCVDHPEYVLGNIKDESLLSIFNNEKSAKFRKTLHDYPDGIFPGCTRCYQLMLFGRKNRKF